MCEHSNPGSPVPCHSCLPEALRAPAACAQLNAFSAFAQGREQGWAMAQQPGDPQHEQMDPGCAAPPCRAQLRGKSQPEQLDPLQQQQEPPAEQPGPSTAQSSVDCRTQQCTRTKAAAQLMQPPMALGRADLLYWWQLASKSRLETSPHQPALTGSLSPAAWKGQGLCFFPALVVTQAVNSHEVAAMASAWSIIMYQHWIPIFSPITFAWTKSRILFYPSSKCITHCTRSGMCQSLWVEIMEVYQRRGTRSAFSWIQHSKPHWFIPLSSVGVTGMVFISPKRKSH